MYGFTSCVLPAMLEYARWLGAESTAHLPGAHGVFSNMFGKEKFPERLARLMALGPPGAHMSLMVHNVDNFQWSVYKPSKSR
jgi:hypothetical protein